MGGGSELVYVVALQELGELIRCEGRALIGVDKARQSILRDELLQALGQGIGRLGCEAVRKGYLLNRLQMSKYSFPLWVR